MSIIQGAERRMDGRAEQGGRVTFLLGQHNPDVLTCIANLSNDEVFTPPAFAGEMLDTLADAWAEAHDGRSIWSDATVTFLDPFTKSGVFLREITKRLVDGLAGQMPDLQQRVDHILTRQVFGIGITQLTALLARRSVYCSKDATGEHSIATGFDRPWGNIWYERTEHTWVNRKRVRQANPLTSDDEVVEQAGTGKCKYCGASEAEYSRDEVLETHAYAFIHTDDVLSRLAEIFGANVHFDVIIGNPPYQLSTGGGTTTQQARPIYQKFVETAEQLDPRYICMITPSRWFSGGMNLDTFRAKMLTSHKLRRLVDFTDSREAFDGVDIAGGVSYFLWDQRYQGLCEVTTVKKGHPRSTVTRPLDAFDVLVRDNDALRIVNQVVENPDFKSLSELVSAVSPFGLPTSFRGAATADGITNPIAIRSASGSTYMDRSAVNKGAGLIDEWKVLLSATASEHAGQPGKDGSRRVFSRIEIAPPGLAVTHSYLIVGPVANESYAVHLSVYLRTRFVRFLAAQTLMTQHVSKSTFAFVPIQDFSRPWTDADLYAKYHLTDEEIAFIESMIRPMELDDNA